MKNRVIVIAIMFWLLGVPVGAVQGNDYKLAMSAEKDVCQLMLSFANDKFHDKGLSSFMQLENLPDLEAPDFELVNWGDEPVNSSLSTVITKSAVFDINNDGQLDWVVKSAWTLSSQYSEQLDIYVNHREPLYFEKGLDSKDLDRADQHFSPSRRTYLLKKLPPPPQIQKRSTD